MKMMYVSGNLMMFNTFLSNVEKQDHFGSKFTINDVGDEIYGSFKPFLNISRLKIEEKCISSIHFSWTHCLIISGGEAYLYGCINNSFGELLRLSIPDKSKIVEGCCTNYRCHFVTQDGGFWSYVTKSEEWKNVTNLLYTDRSSVDLQDDSGSTANRNLFVYKISCGDYLTVAVTNSGIYSVPSLLVFPNLKVLEVTSGKEHTMILTDLGTIYAWGNGSRGQLGHGELESEVNPRELDALTGIKVISVSAGGWHSCCLTENGDLYSWGWNSHGQLGFPGEDTSSERKYKAIASVLAEPRPVDWSDDQVIVKQVSCGSRHTVVVLEDNTVWGCGWNKYGQLHKDVLPEKVFGMTKINVPEEISKNNFKVLCAAWNTVFVTR